ncbi:sugar phosphate isomerase/epimerase family protein [Mucisphaera calidilacus]|uniref:Inosose dehydratase n=1 Tax=Mucisphaera calidilacus TaxID=2527982 RepID=A0A518BYN4_9BACT|nr:sugar phosphate isomerase/epimerase [Mucisphaera calidilacus]QDU72064.1 Inosose dehydratase [Mucisphaera calidilacus]
MSSIPFALQLYSIREHAKQDILDAIKQVASWGYEGVEFAGFHGATPAEIKKLLDDLGLRAAGSHVALETLEGDELNKTLDEHLAVGCTNLVVPYIPEELRDTDANARKTAERFAAVAENLKPHGCKTGFHNHWFDLDPLDGGKSWYDIVAEMTDDTVIMQCDTGNTYAGGYDAVEFIRRYPGRGTTLHLKEYKGERGGGVDILGKAVVGKGDTNWAEVFKAAEEVAGCQWYIVEQEGHVSLDEMEAARQCIENIKALASA